MVVVDGGDAKFAGLNCSILVPNSVADVGVVVICSGAPRGFLLGFAGTGCGCEVLH